MDCPNDRLFRNKYNYIVFIVISKLQEESVLGNQTSKFHELTLYSGTICIGYILLLSFGTDIFSGS